MSKNTNNSDKEQAPPKAKVIFKMSFDIWDDGEITRDLVEKVQGERGAPKAWRLEPRDFAASVKANIGASDKTKIFEAILASLDISVDEMKKTYQLDKVAQAKVDKIASAFGNKEPEGEDINFDEDSK
jgi:hypothetical protein